MRRTLVGDSKATRGSVDAYLAAQPGPVRHVLEALRRTIHSTAPEAEESFSYGMPAFRVRGRPLVAFGAASGHCALYPMNPETIDTHRRLLGRFETSKGTIRFTVQPTSSRERRQNTGESETSRRDRLAGAATAPAGSTTERHVIARVGHTA